jgi:hypothetical protein
MTDHHDVGRERSHPRDDLIIAEILHIGIDELHIVTCIHEWSSDAEETKRWKVIIRDATADCRVWWIEENDSHDGA